MERRQAQWKRSNGRRATRTCRARDPGAHQGQFRAPGLDAASRCTPRTRRARTRPTSCCPIGPKSTSSTATSAGATAPSPTAQAAMRRSPCSPENSAVLTVEYKINLLAPAVGDHIEAVGTVLKSGRTLSVCQVEVFAVQGPKRSLVAVGQQTLICVPDGSSSDGRRPTTPGCGSRSTRAGLRASYSHITGAANR